MSQVCLEQNKLFITGDVTFETVASLYQDLVSHIKPEGRRASDYQRQQNNVLTIDFSRVKQVNSAALALMIEAQKIAVKSNRKIAFQNLPSRLQALAQVCGVEAMLST